APRQSPARLLPALRPGPPSVTLPRTSRNRGGLCGVFVRGLRAGGRGRPDVLDALPGAAAPAEAVGPVCVAPLEVARRQVPPPPPPAVAPRAPRPRHYVEPFAGGLRVLFARDPNDPRLQWGPGSSDRGVSELVNDLDRRVANFWRVLRDQGEEPGGGGADGPG